MTLAVGALQAGFIFQARMFWLKAANLLDPQGSIARVGIESGPKGFDDVWVEYEPSRMPLDQFGNGLQVERMQCKWHAAPGSFTYQDLTSPAYIGATTVSFLQRAHAAYKSDRSAGQRSRLALVTNHRIADSDPLRALIHTSHFTLNLDKLFDGSTDRSKTGKIRKAWRQHLRVNDSDLREFCGAVSFNMTYESLDQLRSRLDDAFRANGIKSTVPGTSASAYEATAFAWVGQGKLSFDRSSFQQLCSREGFLSGPALRSGKIYGVKSFEHPIDRLEDRCETVLNFLAQFDGRFIHDPAAWGASLQPELRKYLVDLAAREQRIRLAMDTHGTLAFAAGAVLDTKSGRVLEVEQRTPLTTLWAPDDQQPNAAWNAWDFRTSVLRSDRPDVAVAVALNRDIEAAVTRYVEQRLPDVGRLLVARPSGGISQTSIACGAHANLMAERLAERIRTERLGGPQPDGRAHIFLAAPNGFAIYLGRHVHVIKPLTLHEYDFEGSRHKTYEPSLKFS